MSTCASCIYYHGDVGVTVNGPPPPLGEGVPEPQVQSTAPGECRIHAPTVDGFPATTADGWCGQIVLRRS